MQLNWKLAKDNNASNIDIEMASDGITFTPLTTVNTTDTNYTASGLTENTTYWFKITVKGATNSVPTLIWATTTSTTLNIASVNSKNELIVSPNPANDFITLKGNGQLAIFNLNGQVIYQQTLNNSHNVNVSQLSNGIYMVILTNQKKQSIQKLVIAH